jgi:hypothetical protein
MILKSHSFMNGFLLDLIIQQDREDSMVLVKKLIQNGIFADLNKSLSFTTTGTAVFKITTHVV